MKALGWISTVAWLGLCACGGEPLEMPIEGVKSEFPQLYPPLPLTPDPYDESTVVEFHLGFTDGEWQKFLAARAAGSKEWVHCSFSFAGQTFADAACRSKGGEEFWAQEPKPQFMIAFNKWDKAGRFMGRRRINLEANPFNAAPVRDRLGMWLMRQVGLKAPRANNVRVFLNGGYLGLYQNIEVLDKEFLESHFEDPGGDLYEDGHKLVTNEAQNDLTRLWALNRLIHNEPLDAPDHSPFYLQLEQMMDVHQVLHLMAAETVLPTPDNFSNGSTNFYYYDDPALQRFVVLPWDLDDIISAFAPPDADIFEYWGGSINNTPNKLRLLMNQHPGWRQEFLDRLVSIRDGAYAQLAALAASHCAQIRFDVAADPNRAWSLAAFDADCASIQRGIRARSEWLRATMGR